ncbi:hypothetical protein [Sphingopyxis yananensis]|uniref:hypothetical protein n=1 Tax=Sphingopyxis yananensis TaxID=2886687 RepID=UPI001D0F8CA7|nr:hypothetical protein [Sphingopyxis yananensis]MCC2602725.1 hypothetical protein [Sphingopyxis yananensis]
MGAKSSWANVRRASAAPSVRCSCECCHTARRREHMQAACISTAASLVAVIVASLIYGAGKALL